MLKTKTKPLFIQGVQKTGTSTLVGMINAHPEIFIMYETRMDKSIISKYGNQFLEKYPNTRSFFKNSKDTSIPYLELSNYFKENNNLDYSYIGDKIISINADETQLISPHKVIYTTRDVRTWLCKEAIINYYRTDLDIVTPAIDFLKYIIIGYTSKDSIHIRMEDLITNNDQVISELSSFLDLDLNKHSNEWWKKIGDYSNNDPKKFIHWSDGHPSSKVKPSKLDTVSNLNNNNFWDEYLPLFDKYYKTDNNTNFRECIEEDLLFLEGLKKHSPLPLNAAYKNISSETITSSSKLKKKIKRKINKIFNS